MKQNFLSSLQMVLAHEGGYVNDPQDPGGATNKGITQHVYDDWRFDQALPKRGVELINSYEVGKIYETLYWQPIKGDELPSGVDYSVFDFAVNSGVGRASRYLQRVVGVADDGKIGEATIAAVKAANPMDIIDKLCAARQKFLEQLPTFQRFGRGWTSRVAEVESVAKGMAA